MIDDPLDICPECGGRIRRVFFPAGIVFKGSGFYKTDHRSSSVADSNGQTTKSDGAAVSSESKSAGESKSATTESSASSTSTNKNKVPAATSTTTKTKTK